jgi:amino acid transporter
MSETTEESPLHNNPAIVAQIDAPEAFKKSLYWWDGFAISLSIPAALFIGVGYAIGAIGAIPTIILSGIVAVISALQNNIYAELAAMFPHKSGGISLYANEAWKSRNVFIGPIATFGYWFGWVSSLGIYALQIGSLVQTQWLSHVTYTVHFMGRGFGVQYAIALGLLVISWGLNVLGIRLAMWAIYLTGILISIPIVIFLIAPLLGAGWTTHLLSSDWHGGGGFPIWKVAIAWAEIQAWSVYGTEAVATFTPEYKRPAHDARRALKLAGICCVLTYALVPLGIGGLIGKASIASNPVTFYVDAFNKIFGAGGQLMTVCIIAGLVLLMVMTSADGGRVLHGSATHGLTIKQFAGLNRFGVPARAISLDLIMNVILVLFLSSTLAIIVAGMLGVFLYHILALSGYVILRRSGVAPRRSLVRRPFWTWVAALLTVANLAIVAIGSLNAKVTGYGGPREVLIGILVLCTSVVLYVFRRVVQDRQPLRLKDEAPPDIAPEVS